MHHSQVLLPIVHFGGQQFPVTLTEIKYSDLSAVQRHVFGFSFVSITNYNTTTTFLNGLFLVSSVNY